MKRVLIMHAHPEPNSFTAAMKDAAVQGFVLMMAILYVLLNLAVDVVVTIIDPRVRFES